MPQRPVLDGGALLDLARADLGRVIGPWFVSETAQERVVRVSPKIERLAHAVRVAARHETGHDPPVRATLDALVELLTDRSLRPPLP